MKHSDLWGDYQPAPALDQLTAECNTAWPGRGHELDGDIGDKFHKRPSGHLPDPADGNLLHAKDLTARGTDMQTLIRCFIHDARAHYAIFQRVIWSRTHNFEPRHYTGSNPHAEHGHFQVLPGQWARSTAAWGLVVPIIPGPSTPGARTLYLAVPRMRGADVAHVQRFIGKAWCGPSDGVYGPNTDRGVRRYQRMRGIPATGRVDALTWSHILGRA